MSISSDVELQDFVTSEDRLLARLDIVARLIQEFPEYFTWADSVEFLNMETAKQPTSADTDN